MAKQKKQPAEEVIVDQPQEVNEDAVPEGRIINRETRLIDIVTKEYPLYLKDLPTRAKPPTSFVPLVAADVILSFGFAEVLDSPIPTNDIVEEGIPVEVEGAWYRFYNAREYTDAERKSLLDAAKQSRNDELDALRAREFEKGMPYTFGDKTVHIPLKPEDISNIQNRRAISKEAIAAGKELKSSFRSYENVTIRLTAVETVAMGDAVNQIIQDVDEILWDLKDKVDEATVASEIPPVPETLFPQ